MKKVLVLGLVGLSLLGVACSGADDPAPGEIMIPYYDNLAVN